MNLFKFLLVTLMICFAAFSIWVALMLFGAIYEGRRAQEFTLYDEIGQRGFQEQNLGLVGIPYNPSNLYFPPNSLDEDLISNGCSIDFTVPEVDAKQYYPAFALLRREPTFRLVYVYPGHKLNFEPYFQVRDYPTILEDIPRFSKDGQISTETRNSSGDLRGSFNEFIAGKPFEITSHECNSFSYTILTKKE